MPQKDLKIDCKFCDYFTEIRRNDNHSILIHQNKHMLFFGNKFEATTINQELNR